MRLVLQTIDMDGVIVVGEGEKHSAPLLFHGEMVGTSHPPAVDIAVDPIEGTPERALSRPNTLSLAALAERWSLWDPGPSIYVDEIVVGEYETIDLNLNQPKITALSLKPTLQSQRSDCLRAGQARHAKLINELPGGRASTQLWRIYRRRAARRHARRGVDIMMSMGARQNVLAACAVKAGWRITDSPRASICR